MAVFKDAGGHEAARAALLSLLLAAAAPAAQAPRAVLLLDAGDAGRPAALAFAAGFREVLIGRAPGPVAVYTEGLDLPRLLGPAPRTVIRALLARYDTERLDAIVAVGDEALERLLEWRPAPWADVPIVFVVVNPALAQESRKQPMITGLTLTHGAEATLDAALRLLPRTKRVAVVAGGDPYMGFVRRALAALGDRVEVLELVDLPLEETMRRVAALPPDTVIFYTNIFVDGTGQGFVSREALDRLAPVANRPIFANVGTYLGHGIVGGALIDAETIGREAAGLMLRLLSGERPQDVPVLASRPNRLLFDARELRRWGLDASRLPRGSELAFVEPTLWQQHRDKVVIAVAVLVIQSLLIAALLVSARRRRRAQRELRELSRRLLTAQEEERRRIARELQEDLGQRLALVAIELDGLGEAGRSPCPEANGRARAISERARDLATDLNRIASELHPAILEHLGLVPALRRYADGLHERHGLRVELDATDWPPRLPHGVSVVLYRVAQEALLNAVQHSGSGEARVTLRGSPGGVSLFVSDKGSGFSPEAEPDRPQPGLAGMRERLRLVGGTLRLESAASLGTIVEASVPANSLALRELEEELARKALEKAADEEAPSPAR